MSKTKIIVALGIILCGFSGYAQQEAQFTQYNDNMLYYNPAYAGSRDMMNVSLLHRQQWVGIEGAPMSQSFSLHTPIKHKSIGLGLSVVNDKVGPLNQTWVNGSFSYTLRLNKNGDKLAFGLSGGLNIVNGRFTELYTPDGNDPIFNQNIQNKLEPLIGGGIYYHSEKWYVGVSIPKIVQSKVTAGDFGIQDERHYYASVGGYISLNKTLKLRPSALLKYTANAPIAADASLALIFQDKLWLGINYRLLESAGVLVQVQLSPQFKIGYSFDISTSNLVRSNYGTHELLLSYDLNFSNKKVISPRFF